MENIVLKSFHLSCNGKMSYQDMNYAYFRNLEDTASINTVLYKQMMTYLHGMLVSHYLLAKLNFK